MLTAFGWLLVREVSQNKEWGCNVIVNLRGRGGVTDWAMHDKASESQVIHAPTFRYPVTAHRPSTKQPRNRYHSIHPLIHSPTHPPTDAQPSKAPTDTITDTEVGMGAGMEAGVGPKTNEVPPVPPVPKSVVVNALMGNAISGKAIHCAEEMSYSMADVCIAGLEVRRGLQTVYSELPGRLRHSQVVEQGIMF